MSKEKATFENFENNVEKWLEETKPMEPCCHRYDGVCKLGQSKWYNNRVTKDMCAACSRYEK